MVSAEQGVLNGIWACTVKREELSSGAFYEPVGQLGTHSKWSEDKVLARKLWDWTDEALKECNV